MLKEKLLRLLSLIRKKESKRRLDPEVERILDKLVEEAVKDPEKEKEILEEIKKAFEKKGEKKNAYSRNNRGNSLYGAEVKL